MKTLITNGQIITPAGTVGGWLLYENGKILEIGTGECPSADETIDAEGRYVSPGFIDIHTHGAGGADYMDGTVEAYLTAAKMSARQVLPWSILQLSPVQMRCFSIHLTCMRRL